MAKTWVACDYYNRPIVSFASKRELREWLGGRGFSQNPISMVYRIKNSGVKSMTAKEFLND
jgi:hypothetical protein